jgi:hypothetical protein
VALILAVVGGASATTLHITAAGAQDEQGGAGMMLGLEGCRLDAVLIRRMRRPAVHRDGQLGMTLNGWGVAETLTHGSHMSRESRGFKVGSIAGVGSKINNP